MPVQREIEPAGHGGEIERIEITVVAGDRDREEARRIDKRGNLHRRDGNVGGAAAAQKNKGGNCGEQREQAVLEAVPDATIIRPSIVFGPEDHFANRFAALARLFPALPLIGADTKLQPVYVGDVATAVADAVDGKTKPGATYELGGPEVVTMREAVELILKIADRHPTLIPLPFGLAKLKATFLQFAPGDLKLTPDQVEMLKTDNVVSDAARSASLTLEGLGIAPDSMAAVLPSYLWRFRKTGQFAQKNA